MEPSRKGTVRVTESTPVLLRSKSIWRSKSEYEEMLIKQVTLLLSENKSLKARLHQVGSLGDEENENEEVLKEKGEVIEELMSHIQNLRSEFKQISKHFASPSDSSRLLEDLVRLTHKNADLCDSLASTQYSRNILEREIIQLKRKLLDERARSCGSLHWAEMKSFIDEGDTLLKEDLKKITKERDHLKMLTASQDEQLKIYAEDVASTNTQIEKLRISQLTEIDQRCKEVDYLKQQFSDQLNSIQQDHNEYAQKLSNVTLERNSLIEKVSELEEANCKLSEEAAKETSRLRSELTAKINHLKRISEHAEQVEYENSALQLRLTQVQRKCEHDIKEAGIVVDKLEKELKSTCIHMESITSQLESLRESNMVLKQQLADLKAEANVNKHKLASSTNLNNEMKIKLEQTSSRLNELEREIHLGSADMSCSLDHEVLALSHAQSTESRHSSHHVDIFHLKQRLADSRQVCVQLEVQLAQAQTDNAKLSGSYQALTSLQEQLAEENNRATSDCRALYYEKESWLTDKEILLKSIDEVSCESLHLSSELAAVKEELDRVSQVCGRRGQEIESSNSKILHAKQLQDDFDHVMSQLHFLYSEVHELHDTMEKESRHLEDITSGCDYEVALRHQEVADLSQDGALCENVNSMRQAQIKVCDKTVSDLQEELEVMRARKTVLVCLSVNKYSPSNSFNPLRVSTVSTVGKLKIKLKLQRKQSNFLRVKLGYTLSELRLYKQLKITCDQQLSELQDSLAEVQRQYYHCTTQLGAVEQQLL